MESTDHQTAVKNALDALYHAEEKLRQSADQYLQNIQRSIDAWQVADNLLHDPSSNLETLIFCSQTLRSKVQRDFEELPSEAFRPLRSSLITLLKKFHRGPPKVRTQISIAVAALAVQVPADDWGDGGIVNWLRDEMNSHPEYIPGFLELLTVLPEEVFNYKIAAHPERRRQFERELTSQMEIALEILTACLKFNELKEQVLEAFASWLRLRHRIPGSVLASHPLVITALSSLNSEILSEAAVNVVSELIHYTTSGNSGGIPVQMPLIQVLVPQVMSLKQQLQDPSKDEEDVKAIARLFADVGDSYVELIATASDESMMIVNSLLEVTSHPEYDIASMTFNFWHSLQVILTKRDSYQSFGDEVSIEAERSRRLLAFRAAYESLVSLTINCDLTDHLKLLIAIRMVIFRVQYSPDYQNLSIEDLKDFKNTRYAVADVLIDAASVLGGDATLKILYMKLAEGLESFEHHHRLYYPLSGFMRRHKLAWQMDKANGVLQKLLYFASGRYQIMSLLRKLKLCLRIMSLMLELPLHPQLLQTVCLTIGAYSKWLDAASNGVPLLPSVMRILMQGMVTSEESAAAAAVAFRHICDDCRKKLCGYLDDLLTIYHKAIIGEGSFRISAEDSLHVVEALSMVITDLLPDQAKKALEQLCGPIVNSLQGVINQGPEILEKRLARELTIHIDRIAYIFRYVNHPEAVADAIQSLWPLFKAIFDLRAWDMRTMESLCRACKYAVRTSGRFMGVTIGAILEEIQALYQQHHQPCFLYLSSEVIKIFGSDPSCAYYLQNLIEALFKHTICLLTNIKDFTARPDIADDCFLLASRCIRYCPQLFIPSTVFPLLVDCAMMGVTVQHREASNSILTFLSDIFDLAKSTIGENYITIRDSVIVPRGSSITRILIASLTGALPSSRIETVAYALLALTRAYRANAVEWAKESLSLIPLTAVTEVERARFLKALSDAASEIDINSLMATIEELSDVCRRNRTVQEIVQGALRPLELNLVGVS